MVRSQLSRALRASEILCRPTVEAANQTAPAFAHIREDMIIVTSTDKPLPRAAKGTVVRPQALKLYATEIDELFADI